MIGRALDVLLDMPATVFASAIVFGTLGALTIVGIAMYAVLVSLKGIAA
jgi:hypothetical protein